MTRHYCVLTQEPRFIEVFKFIRIHNLEFEAHLARTRFWVPEGVILTEFLLRFSECVSQVDESRDIATGLPISNQ
jgi:hypothetical protein